NQLADIVLIFITERAAKDFAAVPALLYHVAVFLGYTCFAGLVVNISVPGPDGRVRDFCTIFAVENKAAVNHIAVNRAQCRGLAHGCTTLVY
ncbi:MAG TPA: hypothetical protein VEA16_03210, partial [Vicinamibacterales bacterium]|nr:hypothetical protein [Vicinamibacterales bacterium]